MALENTLNAYVVGISSIQEASGKLVKRTYKMLMRFLRQNAHLVNAMFFLYSPEHLYNQ